MDRPPLDRWDLLIGFGGGLLIYTLFQLGEWYL